MDIKTVFEFLVGPPSSSLSTAAVFFAVGAIVKLTQLGFKKDVLMGLLKRSLSYLVYIIIANRLDAMGVNTLFGWQGSMQLLVAIWVAVREVKDILALVQQMGEVDLPPIMQDRLDQMERGDVRPGHQYKDSHNLDEEIKYLRENIDKLHEVAKLKAQLSSMSSSMSYETYVPPSPSPAPSAPVESINKPTI